MKALSGNPLIMHVILIIGNSWILSRVIICYERLPWKLVVVACFTMWCYVMINVKSKTENSLSHWLTECPNWSIDRCLFLLRAVLARRVRWKVFSISMISGSTWRMASSKFSVDKPFLSSVSCSSTRENLYVVSCLYSICPPFFYGTVRCTTTASLWTLMKLSSRERWVWLTLSVDSCSVGWISFSTNKSRLFEM